jgi:hypothetical protein
MTPSWQLFIHGGLYAPVVEWAPGPALIAGAIVIGLLVTSVVVDAFCARGDSRAAVHPERRETAFDDDHAHDDAA